MADIRVTETDEVKEVPEGTVSGRRGVDREIRKAEERDGRIGVGDVVDVRSGGRSVERAGSEENGDGEAVGATAENQLA